MKEALNQHVIESYYLGRTISNLEMLPALIRRLKIVDPQNTKYSLRFLTLKDDTFLLYLDHVFTSRLCKNIHHKDILETYQATHPGATPIDAGYLEFNPESNEPVIYLTKTADSLAHYQLGHDDRLRQKSIDLLTPHLSKIGYSCQKIPYVSRPDIPLTQFRDN